jgi:hypothetical protein
VQQNDETLGHESRGQTKGQTIRAGRTGRDIWSLVIAAVRSVRGVSRPNGPVLAQVPLDSGRPSASEASVLARVRPDEPEPIR